MTSLQLAFWIFAALTVLFALGFLWRLLPRPVPAPKSDLAAHSLALTALAPLGTDADSIKTLADALAVALKALGEFGSKLDTLGPTALLGIFTLIFSLCTIWCAWLAR
jgi:hypothetical protein